MIDLELLNLEVEWIFILPSNYSPLVSEGQNVLGGETIISNPNNISIIKKTLKI